MKPARTRLGEWMKRSISTAHIANETGQPVEEIIAERNKAYSRRSFISNSAKIASIGAVLNGAGGCAKSFIDDHVNNDQSIDELLQKKKVAIIGAGIAGLNAAVTLQEKGILADVYEASSRAGGRMLTSYDVLGKGLSAELGAEFINSDHAAMLRLIKKYNLELLDSFDANDLEDTLYFNGNFYTEADVTKEIAPLLPQIIADQQSLSVNINAFNNTETDRFFDNLTALQYLDRIGAKGWIREVIISLLYSEYGAEPELQSALNVLYLASFEKRGGKLRVYYSDERYKIKEGNQQLPIRMAAALTRSVKYGHELKTVKTNNSQYTLSFNRNDGSSISVNYDIVLFAIPFTVLRNVILDVSLPQWKREVIQDLGYGNNSKLLIGFKAKFWEQRGASGGFLTDNAAQSGWSNSLLQPGKTGGLTLYKGAEQAVKLGEGTLQEQLAINLPLLNEIFPGALVNFNGKAERKVWPDDPYSKASYTCCLVGQYTSLLGKQIIPVDNLYFAGEHCSIDYWGFMNGSAETGRAVALKISQVVKS